MALGDNIRRKREEYELDQKELAERVGVSKGAMSGYESGFKVPSVETLVRIADALYCSVDELLGRDVRKGA